MSNSLSHLEKAPASRLLSALRGEVGLRLAAATLTVGGLVVASPEMSASAQSLTRTATETSQPSYGLAPKKIMHRIREAYDKRHGTNYASNNVIKADKTVLAPTKFALNGHCPDNFFGYRVFKEIGDYQYYAVCPSGKLKKQHDTSEPDEWSRPLSHIGDAVAESVGISDYKHGDALHIVATKAKADLRFAVSDDPNASSRQLKELVIHANSRPETTWYQ